MDSSTIVSNMNTYIHDLTASVCKWLEMMLPTCGPDWWEDCVLDNLTDAQRNRIEHESEPSLKKLDLASLLRVVTYSWIMLQNCGNYLPNREKYYFKDMCGVRNRWAHVPTDMPSKEEILKDIEIIRLLASYTDADVSYQNAISRFASEIDSDYQNNAVETVTTPIETKVLPYEIATGSVVRLTSDPDTSGVVMNVESIGGTRKYQVFANGGFQTYFEGQIELAVAPDTLLVATKKELLSNLTAYQIKNPAQGKLYSLNAAKIDFVPYQFRPALRLIKSEQPRLLIADSVGVGKTIEAGIIIKELEARTTMEKVIIICPKPLIAERKWELEMKRFDEDFVPVDGPLLRQILNDCDKEGEWPAKYSKCIIPYSLFTEELLVGTSRGKKKRRGSEVCLANLDPIPHFDMVIVDEAHHVRNNSTFAYKAVEFFCENSDAALFLTATPIQMRNQDLFTLLNLLRPDLIADDNIFQTMAQPNKYINAAARMIRASGNGWQEDAYDQLREVENTDWGRNVIVKNPEYSRVLELLQNTVESKEEKIRLITAIEEMNSFSSLINRTRRSDIQNFCIRGTDTVSIGFSPSQQHLYDALMDFEDEALTLLHGNTCVRFMMTTLMRQAASCIFGLGPSIRDIVNRRMFSLSDDYNDMEFDDDDYDEDALKSIRNLADGILEMSRDLPEDEDSKLDALLTVIREKQKKDNKKVIIFSCFRHTLAYLRRHLSEEGYSVAQIDGSVRDEERFELRQRFAMPSEARDAIDIMLFTEVGSEGLDYQFCDMIINYDLPWNPMRIEQRIGRIDRRGQKSEKVSIINVITNGTIDADIYYRCLSRIGVFENTVGDCEGILGEISTNIQEIVSNTDITDEERNRRLDKLTENSIRNMEALKNLEESEKRFVGFDLAGLIMDNEMKKADDIFISPAMLQLMIENYLSLRLGEGRYITGEGPQKNLRLSSVNRSLLKSDFQDLGKLQGTRAEKVWRSYLRSESVNVQITFDAEYATSNPKAILITATHPLTRQASSFFKVSETMHAALTYNTNDYPEGRYPFGIYSWSYRGYRPESKLIAICSNPDIEGNLFEMITDSDNGSADFSNMDAAFKKIDALHLAKWQEAKNQHISDVKQAIIYKEESLRNGFENRRIQLLNQIDSISNEAIRSMKTRMLENQEEIYRSKLAETRAEGEKVDIHTQCLVLGVLEVRKA